MRLRASTWLALAVSLSSGGAAASADYPGALGSQLELSSAPGCDLCHRAASSPVGPADTAFARSAVSRGLAGAELASVAQAMERMRDDGVDSDGDGAEDLDELSWGGDPNHADLPEAGYRPAASFGCASRPPEGGAGAQALLIAIAAALTGIARARRKPR